VTCEKCVSGTVHLRDERPCSVCGSTFPARKGQRYCSPRCQARGYIQSQPAVTCEFCGKAFKKNRGDRFCSRHCQARLRGRERRIAAYGADVCPLPYRKCRHCGVEFYHRGSVRTGFCGDKCRKGAARFSYERALRKANPLIERRCVECGVNFDTSYSRSVCCSRRCQRRRIRKLHPREKNHRARARRLNVEYEYVNPFKVFSRDRWRCQLCGMRTPKKLRGTTLPGAPELDHIVPLSVGGSHTYSNVQCACRKCNNEKASRIIGQLRLCG
jgi:5-methylcytosine-specific restriction endonuclease McrA